MKQPQENTTNTMTNNTPKVQDYLKKREMLCPATTWRFENNKTNAKTLKTENNRVLCLFRDENFLKNTDFCIQN